MHFPEMHSIRRGNGKAASLPGQLGSGERQALGAVEIGHAAISRSAAESTHFRPLSGLQPLPVSGNMFMFDPHPVLRASSHLLKASAED